MVARVAAGQGWSHSRLAAAAASRAQRLHSRKIRLYLLSRAHPVGRHKLRFLEKAGYRVDRPDMLRAGLLTIARTGTVVDRVVSGHGTSYRVDGVVAAPNGFPLQLRTVWIVNSPGEPPRFVTAYPASSDPGRSDGTGT